MSKTNDELIQRCHTLRSEVRTALELLNSQEFVSIADDGAEDQRCALKRVLQDLSDIIEGDWRTRVAVAGAVTAH